MDIAGFGGSPTAADNRTAFVSALATATTVTVNASGTYLLSDKIAVPSGRSIIGSAGVILKKSAAYSHVFYNAAIASGSDTAITLQNLTIDEDGKGDRTYAPVATMNGILCFRNLTGLTLDHISIINGDAVMFGIHLESVTNALVTEYSYSGAKDGFHLTGGCDTITVDGFDITSGDDAFGIIGHDYPEFMGSAQDITNVIVRNGISRDRTPQGGYFMRLITGSWAAWGSGNTYSIGHCCVNAGKIYKKTNAGDLVAANAPVHTSGTVTGADGIAWHCLGSGVQTTLDIVGISVHNVTLACGRVIGRVNNDPAWDNNQYPGTENTSILDDFHTSLPAANFANEGLLGTTYFDE